LCYKIGENLYAAWVMFHDGIWGFFLVLFKDYVLNLDDF
jgi:hypothetical protein